MAEVRVRPMTAEDLDGVIAMARETPEAPQWERADYPLCAGVEASVKRSGLVAEDGGVLAGFAVARVLPPVAELESIVVDRRFRRMGIGAALLAGVVESARRQGAGRLELEVRQSNRAAMEMYERAGMRVDGRRPAYYSDPEEDAVLMSLHL